MNRIKIFISSAEKELAAERKAVATVAKALSAEAFRFEVMPKASGSPDSQFIPLIKACDIFVLILGKELRPWPQREHAAAVALHKPMLVFVKNVPGQKRDKAMKEFVQRFQGAPSSGHRRTSTTVFKSSAELKARFRQNLMLEVSKLFSPPNYSQTREKLYEIGSNIIHNAQKRLLINQPRPTFLLGPKNRGRHLPNGKTSHVDYEQEFLRILNEWIDVHKDVDDVRMIYLYDPRMARASAAAEIKSNANKRKDILDRISRAKRIEEESNGRIKFMPMRMEASGPFCIGDNRYALWVMGDEKFAICFEKEDPSTADFLSNTIVTQNGESISEEDMLNDILGDNPGPGVGVGPLTEKGYRKS